MSVILSKIKKEAIIYCPLCNKEYSPKDMRIVEQAGDTILAHSHCPYCEGSILSLLYSDFLGITLVGLVTDLKFEDAIKFKNADQIEENDILTLYKMINNKKINNK